MSQIWIVLYLTLGASLLLAIRLMNNRKFSFEKSMQETIQYGIDRVTYPDGKPIWVKLREHLGTALIAGLLLPIWPIVCIWALYESLSHKNRDDASVDEPTKFFSSIETRIKKITVDEVEQLETYQDPLDALPDKPLGHLHHVWLDFKNEIKPRDEIWIYRRKQTTEPDRWLPNAPEDGYVLMRNGQVIREIFTSAD